MRHSFQLTLLADLPLGDLVADVTLEGGAVQAICIQDGRYAGHLPARPTHLRLTGRPADADPAPAVAAAEPGSAQDLGPPPAADATPGLAPPVLDCALEDLVESGRAIPPPGDAVVYRLTFGLHCHAGGGPPSAHVAAPVGTKFLTFEHQQCAEFIGLDLAGLPLRVGDREADFDERRSAALRAIDARTVLPVGALRLTFGQIVALGGDYYAHLDPRAATEFAWAWPDPPGRVSLFSAEDYRRPTLAEEHPGIVQSILDVADRDRDRELGKLGEAGNVVRDGMFGDYPVRRYMALASQNFCHFAQQPMDGTVDDDANAALRLYRAYHGRALAAAAAGDLPQALVADAFGCHFLTDLFAAGHMRVPRRELDRQDGIVRGALIRAHDMHCEDNQQGLWCTTRLPQGRRRWVWRAYGDGQLLRDAARCHFAVVKEAVRRSAAEVFLRFAGQDAATWPAAERAEALIPVVLPPDQGPRPDDALPAVYAGAHREPFPAAPVNHYPLYAYLADRGAVAHRVGGPWQNQYRVGLLDSAFALDFGVG